MIHDDLILRVDKQTFADDSFKIADPAGLVVDAELTGWSELRWHGDLVRRCEADLKWTTVRHYWQDLSVELRRAVVRDLRDALIIIVDPSLYRFDLEQSIATAIGQPKATWPGQFRAWAEAQIVAYEMQSILFDSPAAQIQYFLEDDGLTLGDVGGIDGNTDESRFVLTELQEKLENPHNVRLFGARSAAAFAHVLDSAEWNRAVEPFLHDMRYVSPQQVLGYLLAVGERIQRVFDEGNKRTVSAISDLKDAVRTRLVNSHQILLTDDTPAGAIELSSTTTPILQAADIAAGYARTLYLERGLRAVCEEFKGVILNGSMIRDWSRVDRPNLTELQVRK